MQTYNVGILKPRNIKELEYLLQQKGIWFEGVPWVWSGVICLGPAMIKQLKYDNDVVAEVNNK